MDEIKEQIINLLKDKRPRDLIEIVECLNLGREFDKDIIELLNEMANDYTLYFSKKNRYMLFQDSEVCKNLVKGKYLSTNNDYGFVEIGNGKEDIFVHNSNNSIAINGDVVLVEILKQKKGGQKCEGRVLKIVKRESKAKVGEVYHDQGKLFVALDDKKISNKVLVDGDSEQLERLVDGDKIQVEFNGDEQYKDYIHATYIQRIGNINDPDIDIISIIVDNGFMINFSDEVKEELKSINTEVKKSEFKGRRDLRDEVIFTIDGDDTKDIDDAISIKKLDNGHYVLGVHIADVSYYIKENSPLDIEARQRGTSVYLTDRVVPMLPHQLSNGICSLNPNVDRLAVSCVMEINDQGSIVDYDIFPSVIKSRLQMTYKKVNSYLENNEVFEDYEPFTKDLSMMQELSEIIRKSKIRRGFIDFDTDEIKIIVDEKGHPIDIKKRDRGIGERIIEDFMIMANECVATHMYYMDLPSLYRVHGVPSIERLKKLMTILNSLGINMNCDLKKVTPSVIQRIIDELKHYEEFKVLSTQILSCMDKAKYATDNIGHFGIASKCYTHFTSPIRRYPDTTIHRLLRNYFFMPDGVTDEKINHFTTVLPDIAMHSSEQERASIDCEREVDSLKMAEYMENHIGEEFRGMISGITSFGMFVILENLIEGLVPIVDMDGYYTYQEKNSTLTGQKNGNCYKIGDEVIVVVTNASKQERKIDFRVVKRIEKDGKTKVKTRIKTKY